MTTNGKSWKSWQKISFRFFFLFLILSSVLCWDLTVYFTVVAVTQKERDLTSEYKPLAGTFHWLDTHIFHTGYDPKKHASFPQDNHFGEVFYLTLFLIAVLATVGWTVLDKRRPNYNRLFYWFNVYMRYTLAITILGYGLIKLIPVQMSYPHIVDMTIPYGEQGLFNVLWNFMGVSPGYMILTGASEILAALLLLFRRTVVLGCIFMIFILVNVTAMNWFYNVPVKMFSAQLLFYALFLVAPFAKQLFQFFFKGAATVITVKEYTFQTKWKRYLLTTLMIVVPLAIIVLLTIGDSKRYIHQAADARKEKIYDVTAFVAKDTLPPLTTDTLRWSRLALFVYGNYAVIYNMKNKLDWYQCDVDSIKKTFTLHDNPDKKKWKLFHYIYPSKNQLQLTGKWKGKDINVLLKSSSTDSIPLNHEKIKLITD